MVLLGKVEQTQSKKGKDTTPSRDSYCDESVDLFPIEGEVMSGPGDARKSMKIVGGNPAIDKLGPQIKTSLNRGSRRKSSVMFYMQSPILPTDWQKNSIYLPGESKNKMKSGPNAPITKGYYKRRWDKAYRMRRCVKIAQVIGITFLVGLLIASLIVIIMHPNEAWNLYFGFGTVGEEINVEDLTTSNITEYKHITTRPTTVPLYVKNDTFKSILP